MHSCRVISSSLLPALRAGLDCSASKSQREVSAGRALNTKPLKG